MIRLRRAIVEIHRRSLWQVLSIYLVGSWIGYQVILNLTQGIGLPQWVPGFAVVLFIIGLPVVLATAFVQEGLPARRADEPAAHDHAPTLAGRAGDEGAADVLVPTAARPSAGPRHHWLLTWKRAVLGVVVAFLLLGITAGGYVGLRNSGVGPFGTLIAAGKLDARERLLVAEFEASAGAEDLARALTHAFRVDLSQSPVVTVLEPAYARAALERMQWDPTSAVGPDLAREIALREGLKALVTGQVMRAGQGYVLSVSLVSVADGAPLASVRESAADSTVVLDAVDRVSRRLRERIGESLRTVHAGERLAAVTTPSLEALRKYSHGVHALDVENDERLGIALLHEALAHDSTFGMAWRKLAVAYNRQQVSRDRVIETATKAYAHRDRMTSHEREHTVAFYHMYVALDNDAAIAVYRAVLRTHPDDAMAHTNIGILYGRERRYDLAIEHFERSLEIDSTRPHMYSNLSFRYHFAGRLDDAERVLAQYRDRFGETRQLLNEELHLAASRGDLDRAAGIARRLLEMHSDDPAARAIAEHALAGIAVLRGRLAERNRHRAAAATADEQRGVAAARLLREVDLVWVELMLLRDTAAAEHRLLAALQQHPIDSLPPVDRPYDALVLAFAELGRPDRVRALMREFEAAVPPELRGEDILSRARWEEALARAEGRHADVIARLRVVEPLSGCERCMAIDFALAFDRAGQADSAIARYEQFLALPDARRLYRDSWMPHTHERLAQLYADAGDDTNAVRHAALFVNLWEDADPALQPRVTAKREWLRRRVGEG
jgi:eukaryotic-like serine/threonine-protein kinase